MNQTGEIIKNMRIRSGFTQKSLAGVLHVTDKAISKWERGICLPDTVLLPKLALILDIDIELLVANEIEESNWVGLIDIKGCDFRKTIYDKPLIYYLLSHYLLLGIKDVYIISDELNKKCFEEPRYKKFGFRFYYDYPNNKDVMMINHPWFLFGSDLTQQFQGAMMSRRLVKLLPENQCTVFYFVPKEKEELIKNHRLLEQKAIAKTLGRGMIAFDMGDSDKCLDVATFVKVYQKNARMPICSLEEIAYKNGYIDSLQLNELSENMPYAYLFGYVSGKPQVD